MRKYVSFFLTSALMTGASVAANPQPFAGFAFGFGGGVQSGDIKAKMGLNDQTGTTSDSFKFKQTDGYIDIYARGYFPLCSMQMFAQVGMALSPWVKRAKHSATLREVAVTTNTIPLYTDYHRRWTGQLLFGVNLFSIHSATFAFTAGGNYSCSWLDGRMNETARGGRYISARKKTEVIRPSVGGEVQLDLGSCWSAYFRYTANQQKRHKVVYQSTVTNNIYTFKSGVYWSHQYGAGLEYKF